MSERRENPRQRRWLVCLCAILMPLLGTVAIQAPAEAASGTVKVRTQKMAGPHLSSYKQLGWYSAGTRLTLSCYVWGQTVSGWGGRSNLWYRVSDGVSYVADVDLFTGSDAPITPKCGTAPATGLSARVDSFRATWIGKRADYDGAYGAQCVDLFNFYNRDVVKAARPAVSYAYQLWDKYDGSRYTRVGAGSAPKKGDVAIWSSGLPGSGGAGHVAIVLGTSGSSLVVLQQNYRGQQYVSQNNASKSYLRGYLRPKS